MMESKKLILEDVKHSSERAMVALDDKIWVMTTMGWLRWDEGKEKNNIA